MGPQQVSAHLLEAKTASHIDMVLADCNWLNVPKPDLCEIDARGHIECIWSSPDYVLMIS